METFHQRLRLDRVGSEGSWEDRSVGHQMKTKECEERFHKARTQKGFAVVLCIRNRVSFLRLLDSSKAASQVFADMCKIVQM